VYHRDGGSASNLLSNHLPRSNDFRLGFSFEIKPLHQTLVPQREGVWLEMWRGSAECLVRTKALAHFDGTGDRRSLDIGRYRARCIYGEWRK
jgi:hypothetical protein